MDLNFGSLLIFDLKDIDPTNITNEYLLRNLLKTIVEDIMEMKIIQQPMFEYFEDNEYNREKGLIGYSITCIISLSSITVHICDIQKTAFFDIFTCCILTDTMIDEINQVLFNFFKQKETRTKLIPRGVNMN